MALALIYAAMIVLGTGALMLPFASANGLRGMEAWFTAASAVTITGLTVIDPAADLTLFGQAVILLLVQVSGLGIMTFAVSCFDKWHFTRDPCATQLEVEIIPQPPPAVTTSSAPGLTDLEARAAARAVVDLFRLWNVTDIEARDFSVVCPSHLDQMEGRRYWSDQSISRHAPVPLSRHTQCSPPIFGNDRARLLRFRRGVGIRSYLQSADARPLAGAAIPRHGAEHSLIPAGRITAGLVLPALAS